MLGVVIIVYLSVMAGFAVFLSKKCWDKPEEVIVVASVFWPITVILYILRVVVDLVQNQIILRWRKK